MTKITIENFQSIKKVNFDIKGFTVIIGKNNIGKSAIIRAIEAALDNQTGDSFIRKGQKKTKVIIDNEDITLQWEKSKTTATYEIKGYKETFSKLKGTVPKPIIKAGFQKMQIGNQKLFPLIASQFEPLFLINKPGSVVTEVLASLYQIDTLSTADDLCQKILKSNKSLLKTRELDLKTVQEKLEKFKDFEEIKQIVLSLVEEEKRIQDLRKELTLIENYEEQLKTLTESLKRLRVIKDIKIPDKSECEKLTIELPWLREMSDKYLKSVESTKKLKGISSIIIPKESECEKVLLEVEWLQEKNERCQKSTSIVKELKKLPEILIPETKEIETLLTDTLCVRHWEEGLQKTGRNIRQQETILKTLDIEKVLKAEEETSLILKEFTEYKLIEKNFFEIIETLKTTRENLNRTNKKWEELNKEMGKIEVCPLCERPL